MNIFKKVVALLLALVFTLSLAACHQKDEIAISAGKYNLTSAVYSYFLTMADSEAKTLINNSDAYDTKAKGFSYYKQKIEGKSFEDYVKDLAMEKCLRYLTLEKLGAEAKLTLSDAEKANWKNTANYYWNYAYGAVLLENGVSYSTYEKILLNDAIYNLYFEHLYAKGGEKAVSDKDIKDALSKNYTAVYMISHDYSEEKEPDVDAIAKDLDKYVSALKDGKVFADVLADYNKDYNKDQDKNTSSSTNSSKDDSSKQESSKNDSSSNTSSTTSSEDKKEEEKKPADSNISVVTKYENTYTSNVTFISKYADVEKLKDGEVALIHDEDAKTYYVVVKKDINADPYYLDTLTQEILYLLKTDEFDKLLKDTAKGLEVTVNKYAVNQFKVKKIFDGSQS
jgi:hypothetical protein